MPNPFSECDEASLRMTACFHSLQARDQAILLRRHEGLTLAKIGENFDLTRERIRQIEKKARKTLLVRLKKSIHDWEYFKNHYLKLDVVDFIKDANEITKEIYGQIILDIVLTKMGWEHYQKYSRWWVRDRSKIRNSLSALNIHEPMDISDWERLADESDLPSDFVDQIVGTEHLPIEKYRNYMIRTQHRRRDRAHAYLLDCHEATTGELLDAVVEDNDMDYNAIRAFTEFMRRQSIFTKLSPQDVWTLSGLVEKRYKSALPAALEILASDGPMEYHVLCQRVRKVHPVSDSRIAQCLDNYQIGFMPDGRVWLVEHGAEKPDEPEPNKPEYMSISGPIIGLRKVVTHDVMRGSGCMESKWLSWKLGLKTTPASITFTSKNGGQDFTVQRNGWNSSFSSIRETVKKMGLAEGCQIVIIIDTKHRTWDLHHKCDKDICPTTNASLGQS